MSWKNTLKSSQRFKEKLYNLTSRYCKKNFRKRKTLRDFQKCIKI